ncbi:MAG: AMP-binding protein, partial [Phycisphaerae bacterium]
AVQLTHRNLIANATALLKVHSVGSADQLLSVLPMYHAFEFTGGFLVPLACGATITYVEQLKRPDIVTAMQATGTTCMLVVPRLLRMFHDSIENTVASSGPATRLLFRCLGALSTLTGHRFGRTLYGRVHRRFGGRLRMFVSGGSRLDPALFTAFTRMGFEVYEGYGLTETAPVLAVNPSGRARAGSVGPPLPGVDIRIHNANLEGIGEVLVRGPSVMVGYLKNPAATDEVLVDRWLHTGDLGRLDGDGYLYLTGRSKDLIVTGAGKNVYPDEVEAYYGDLPFARELCVFGMPSDDGMGDMIHAVVVIDSSTSPELDRSSIEREIRLAVTGISESLPSHQRITTLHFWECDLPKTSTLKAKRSLIRDMVRAEQSAEGLSSPPAPTPGGPPARVRGGARGAAREPVAADGAARWSALCAILSRQASRPSDQIRADMHLHLDLGIDSIGKMEILGEVEAVFDKRIDGNDAAGVARVSDLLKLIGPRLPKGKAGRVVRAVTACVPDAAAPAANGAVPAPLLPLRWAFRGGVAALMHSYVRVRACGCENIPSSGAFVLAPNHASHLDSPSVVTAVGGRRRVWIAGAEDYFFSSTWKRIVFGMLLDTIPFDRKADGVLGLRRCAEALARGDGLLLFPEGTRSTTGDLQPFKIGVAVLSLERQVPIIPVYIDSTYRLLAKGARFVRPGRITVTFGRPIPPPPPVDQGDRLQVLRALAQQVERAVSELSGQPAV